MTTTDELLALVRRALDEFDDRPLSATVRRAVRIANLLGESEIALRLAFEVKSIGGDSRANAEDARRLLADPGAWGDPEGPAESAVREYMEDRRVGSDKVQSSSIDTIEHWERYFAAHEDIANSKEILERRIADLQMLERARHHTFTALCKWERQLSLGSVSERIFSGFERRVQRLLAEGAPALVDQFNAVFRRMRDAARIDSESASEEFAQAVGTCRRILKAVIDHVFPGHTGLLSEEGHVLDAEKYRNRLREFTKTVQVGDRMRGAAEATIVSLCDRFDALDGLASKGVHAGVALEEAELCAINTFIVAGEILRLHETTLEALVERG